MPPLACYKKCTSRGSRVYQKDLSRADEYQKQEQDLCDRQRNRQYPNWCLKRAEQLEGDIPRRKLLKNQDHFKQRDKCNETQPLIFITQYSPYYNESVNIVKKYLPFLNTYENLWKILQFGVKFFSRRSPTLGSKFSLILFTSQSYKLKTWLNTKGFFCCGHNHCTACKHVVKTVHFYLTTNNTTYSITSYVSCNTRYVISLITCIACTKQYVGCTSNSLKITIRRHLQNLM